MIELYSGTPGSGKSLHATMRAYNFVKLGRPVIANYSLRFPKEKQQRLFSCWDNMEVTPDALVSFAASWWASHEFREERILLILDECQLIFNSRSWDARGQGGGPSRMDWIRFFSQHRKYGYRIILIAQFDRMIDRQIRALIETETKHRKPVNMGWRGVLLSLMLGGPGAIVCASSYYGMGMHTTTEVIRARRKYFRLYDTRATFQGDGAAVSRSAPQSVADGVAATGGGGLASGFSGGPDAGTAAGVAARHYARLGV